MKTAIINIRVSPAQKDQIVAAAKFLGKPVSQYILDRLFPFKEHEEKHTPIPPEELVEKMREAVKVHEFTPPIEWEAEGPVPPAIGVIELPGSAGGNFVTAKENGEATVPPQAEKPACDRCMRLVGKKRPGCWRCGG